MEHIHMFPVNLIFPIYLTKGKCSDRLTACKARLYLREHEVVVPHDRGVRTENVFVVQIISIGFAARGMVRREIKEVKTFPRGNHLGCRSEEHTSELQSPDHLVCRLLLEKKKHH